MTAMDANPIAVILERLDAVAFHAPWRRFDVDAKTWTAIAKSLGDGAGDLLSLWGDAGAVYMALRTPSVDPCVISLVVAEGGFPSVGRFHPPAIRLERAVCDLYGHKPADAPDCRAWLDHGQWGLRAPLGAGISAPRRDPVDHLHDSSSPDSLAPIRYRFGAKAGSTGRPGRPASAAAAVANAR